MACTHCGSHLLYKRERELRCCGCGRLRTDRAQPRGASSQRRHRWIALAAVLSLPVALAFAIAAIDAARTPAPLTAELPGEATRD